MSLKTLLRALVPKSVRRGIKHTFHAQFKQQIDWEYLPQGWRAAAQDPAVKGWNVADIRERYAENWHNLERHLSGSGPLGFWYESGADSADSLVPHNIHMSFAYALGLASRGQTRITMLDWGGGLGHYYALAQTLYPDLAIDYTCKEMPVFVEEGQRRHPQAHFHADDQVLDSTYDFVVASGSMHYEEDWKLLLARLARATSGYLYVARTPVVRSVPEFVFVQRPYAHGYNTEYISWALNVQSLLGMAQSCGLTLVREFVMGENPDIDHAPEPVKYAGFLFRAA